MTSSRPFRLSVLDLAPVLSGSTPSAALQNTLDLARHVDELGYERYWLAEHHGMEGIASSSPEILIGHVAQVTKRIRVGSGGIMLPNHSPLQIAERFRTLEALHPGRIDLGIGRAPGTNTRTTRAIRGDSDEKLRADDFPERLSELMTFLSDGFPKDHPLHSVIAMPTGVESPEIWILGSSDFGAQLAAELGLGFAFAQHFSPLAAEDILPLYQSRFRPSPILSKPHSIVATGVICAETDDLARELAVSHELAMLRFRRFGGKSEPLPSVAEALAYPYTPSEREQIRLSPGRKFVGSQKTLQRELSSLAENCGADEVMVMTMIHDHELRKESYRLLAQAFSRAF